MRWICRLWVRLISRRATPEEIAAQKIPQAEMDRATERLQRIWEQSERP
jgi:hypothetical protein